MDEWLNTLWYMLPMEHYSVIKRGELLIHLLDGLQGNYTQWKKSLSKGYMLYDFIYITVLKWQNYRNEEQISGF